MFAKKQFCFTFKHFKHVLAYIWLLKDLRNSKNLCSSGIIIRGFCGSLFIRDFKFPRIYFKYWIFWHFLMIEINYQRNFAFTKSHGFLVTIALAWIHHSIVQKHTSLTSDIHISRILGLVVRNIIANLKLKVILSYMDFSVFSKRP